MRPRLRALVFVVGVVSLGPHCKTRDRAVATDAGEYAVVRDKDGTETRVRLGAGPIPPEFPPAMELYPGAEFTSTARTKGNVIVALSTTDSLEAVFAFYRKQPGYEEISDVEVRGMRVLNLKHQTS